MTVEELYNLMEKRDDKYTYWCFIVYVDGLSENILAYANGSYDVEGKNKISYALYSVKDLFNHEVVSFYPECDGIYVKINKFQGLKYKELQSYTDEDGKERGEYVIKVWNN